MLIRVYLAHSFRVPFISPAKMTHHYHAHSSFLLALAMFMSLSPANKPSLNPPLPTPLRRVHSLHHHRYSAKGHSLPISPFPRAGARQVTSVGKPDEAYFAARNLVIV